MFGRCIMWDVTAIPSSLCQASLDPCPERGLGIVGETSFPVRQDARLGYVVIMKSSDGSWSYHTGHTYSLIRNVYLKLVRYVGHWSFTNRGRIKHSVWWRLCICKTGALVPPLLQLLSKLSALGHSKCVRCRDDVELEAEPTRPFGKGVVVDILALPELIGMDRL